jgi:hypothetical protein
MVDLKPNIHTKLSSNDNSRRFSLVYYIVSEFGGGGKLAGKETHSVIFT